MRVTIKTKLGLAFGLIIAMSAGAITLGVENLGSLNTSLNKLVEGPAAQRTMALRLVNDVLLLIRAQKNMLLAGDDTIAAKFEAEDQQQRTTIDQQRAELETSVDADGKTSVSAFNAAYQKFLAIDDKVRDLGRHNSNNVAQAWMEKDGTALFDQANHNLAGLIARLQQSAATAATQHAIVVSADIQTLLATLQRDDDNVIIATTDETMAPYHKAIVAEVAMLLSLRDTLRQAVPEAERKTAEQFSEQTDSIEAFENKFVPQALLNSVQHATDLSMSEGRAAFTEVTRKATDLVDLLSARMARTLADAQNQSRHLAIHTDRGARRNGADSGRHRLVDRLHDQPWSAQRRCPRRGSRDRPPRSEGRRQVERRDQGPDDSPE